MKNKLLTLVASLAAVVFTASAQSQSVYLVEITDMAKASAYQIMSRDEVAALKKQIAEEARAFPTALAAVRKEWEAAELTQKTFFPANKLAPRKMREQGPFSAEQAAKKKERLEDRMIDNQIKEAKKQKPKGKSDGALAKQAKEMQRSLAVDSAHDQLCAKLKEALGREIPKNGFGGEF